MGANPLEYAKYIKIHVYFDVFCVFQWVGPHHNTATITSAGLRTVFYATTEEDLAGSFVPCPFYLFHQFFSFYVHYYLFCQKAGW